MKSLLAKSFVVLFRKLPEYVRHTARKNYRLWKENHSHPGLEFKCVNQKKNWYSVRVGIGWRAVGVRVLHDDVETIVWFWIGSHSDYDKLL